MGWPVPAGEDSGRVPRCGSPAWELVQDAVGTGLGYLPAGPALLAMDS